MKEVVARLVKLRAETPMEVREHDFNDLMVEGGFNPKVPSLGPVARM